MTTQIFIVEDHPAVRSAYVALLERAPDLKVCGTAASGEKALISIPQKQPDLVLVDLSLPFMDDISLIARLYQTKPTLPVLIVSSHERMGYAMLKTPALAPSVKGFIPKQEAPQLLVATIQQLLYSK